MAEEFVETILTTETARPPGSERVEEDSRTIAESLYLNGKKHTIALLHQFAMTDGSL